MELRTNQEAFLSCPKILDFERKWVEEYVAAIERYQGKG